MNLHQVGKIILICIMMSASFVLKGQEHGDAFMSAYVSALERDLQCNDSLYRMRRAVEFDHASALAVAGYAEMPVDSIAAYVTLLESHDTLSQDNMARIAALKAYKDRLNIYNDAYAVTCVKYDSVAVASATASLKDLKGRCAAGVQTEDVDALMAALALFGEHSSLVRERFNITDARVDRRIKLYGSRKMDSVLAKSLSEDFLEPWFVTDQIKTLNAESPIEYIRTVTGRMFSLMEQIKSLDATSPVGKANELLEELLGIVNEL